MYCSQVRHGDETSGADYRTIGHLFGVSKSSVCLVTKEVCSSIVSQLLPQFVRFPTGSALTELVVRFKNELGFPQCVGAVDGCHIPIVSPPDCLADYCNQKGWHSIILQGTVDFRGVTFMLGGLVVFMMPVSLPI